MLGTLSTCVQELEQGYVVAPGTNSDMSPSEKWPLYEAQINGTSGTYSNLIRFPITVNMPDQIKLFI